MRASILALVLVSAAVVSAHAQSSSNDNNSGGKSNGPQAESSAVLDEVLVTGEQPGPALWRVVKPTPEGDHVMWILGTLTPLPKKMIWRYDELAGVLAKSQEVIAQSSVRADIGFFKSLTLLPSLIGVRNNPDDKKLRDVVPPDLYARWLVLKGRYLGRDRSVEKWRPIFAAQALYSHAIEDSGLESGNRVWPVVEKLAKKYNVPIVEPKVDVKIDKPRAAVKEFKKSELADVGCFAKTLERLEKDLIVMRARANAWSRGDMEVLRAMGHTDQVGACIAAVMSSQLVHERGYDVIPEQLTAAWLRAVDQALEKNTSTVAVLPIDELFKSDGYVAKLRDKGYRIEEP